MLKFLLTLCAVLTIQGCATTYIQAPTEKYLRSDTNQNLTITNKQPDKQARQFFSDGISTYVTDYPAWNDILITNIYQAIENKGLRLDGPKEIAISISSIMCGGHYASDCIASALVEYDDGTQELYTSDKITGWRAWTVMETTLNDLANKIVNDRKFNTIFQK